MKVFLIRSLLFISICSFFSGCAFRNYGLKDSEANIIVSSIKEPLIFPDTLHTVLFKTQVDLYGNYFGGLLLIKKIKNQHFRLVMTTETGFQLFDFELNKDSLRVISCLEKLRRKAVINTLETDFRLILFPELYGQKQSLLLTDHDQNHLVYKFRKGKKLTYYFIENKTGYLDRIEQAGAWYKKVSLEVERSDHGIPDVLLFTHHGARLTIKLKLLKIS